jgi:protoporphyrinogen oxidase
MTTAVIIGAGPAGLTAAYELERLGVRPTVLEADSVVGGLSRTVEHRGYRFDIGGHRFFSKVPLVNELWEEILGEDLLRRPRLSRIYYNGRYFDYPLRPLNALLGLGPIEAVRIALSYAWVKITPAAEETNLEQWVSNRFGRRLYEIFFKTYTEKVWGIPCSEISADWAAQRIKNLSFGEALRAMVFRSGKDASGQVITTLIDEFLYPRFGPGMMWERCAERVESGGGEVLLGVRAEKVRHRDGRVVAVEGRGAGGETAEFAADHFISTMAVRDLVRALDPPPPEEVRCAAEKLTYRDYLAVALIVKRPDVFPDNWIYIHSPEVRLGRIQNYKNWSPEMVPDPSRTTLGLEYFLWESDPEWTYPAERLIEDGIADCVRIGILAPEEVEGGTVVRVPKAYPVYDQNYRDHLAVVRSWLEGLVNLQLVGRNGQHRYNNQDHSMLAGVYAARNITGASHDVWAVNTEAAYHEDGAAHGTGDRLVPSRIEPSIPLEAVDPVAARVLARLDPVALGAALGVVGGVGLFLATVTLLIKGGPVVGPTLSLLTQYLPGYSVTWRGAIVGLLEAMAGGFALGVGTAWLRNRALFAYARNVQRRATAKLRERILDEV